MSKWTGMITTAYCCACTDGPAAAVIILTRTKVLVNIFGHCVWVSHPLWPQTNSQLESTPSTIESLNARHKKYTQHAFRKQQHQIPTYRWRYLSNQQARLRRFGCFHSVLTHNLCNYIYRNPLDLNLRSQLPQLLHYVNQPLNATAWRPTPGWSIRLRMLKSWLGAIRMTALSMDQKKRGDTKASTCLRWWAINIMMGLTDAMEL